MPSGCFRKALASDLQTAQVIAFLPAHLPVQLALRFTHAQTLQPRPVGLLFDIVGRVDMPIPPRFDPPVLAIYCLVLADLITKGSLINDGIEEALDFAMEVALI